MAKNLLMTCVFVCFGQLVLSQDNASLDVFLDAAMRNAPGVKVNDNLEQIGRIQEDIIRAQNNAFQVSASSEILFAPYFNNNGRVIDVTTTPSPTAYGYDVGITNGGLYSAQLNVTKNLLNQASVDNLLLQNKVSNESIALSTEEMEHTLAKNMTDAYIMAYQLQLQADFTSQVLEDLKTRLKVLGLLVKKGIVQQSDYMLLQLDIEGKQLELKQIKDNLNNSINQMFTLAGIPVHDIERLEAPNISRDNSSIQGEHYYERKYTNDSLQVKAGQLVYENAYRPQLTVYGNTGLNAVELNTIAHKIGMSAGLRLTIPIYDGKQRKYNAQQNKLKVENMDYVKMNSQVQLDNNLKNIDQQLTAVKENRDILTMQIHKQEEILEIYKGKLVQGQVSIIDYLNVMQNYRQYVFTDLQMQTNTWLLQSQYNFINW